MSFDHGTFHIFIKHVYISQQFVSYFFIILYVFRIFFIPTGTCEFGTPPIQLASLENLTTKPTRTPQVITLDSRTDSVYVTSKGN